MAASRVAGAVASAAVLTARSSIRPFRKVGCRVGVLDAPSGRHVFGPPSERSSARRLPFRIQCLAAVPRPIRLHQLLVMHHAIEREAAFTQESIGSWAFFSVPTA